MEQLNTMLLGPQLVGLYHWRNQFSLRLLVPANRFSTTIVVIGDFTNVDIVWSDDCYHFRNQ